MKLKWKDKGFRTRNSSVRANEVTDAYINAYKPDYNVLGCFSALFGIIRLEVHAQCVYSTGECLWNVFLSSTLTTPSDMYTRIHIGDFTGDLRGAIRAAENYLFSEDFAADIVCEHEL